MSTNFHPTEAPTPSAPPQPPQKPARRTWLYLLLGFACMCSCLGIALFTMLGSADWSSLFDTGAPQVRIGVGTYEGSIYTAPDGNFSCDFKDIMADGLGAVLQASEDVEHGMGTVYALDDFGQQYGVDYFNIPIAGDAELMDILSSAESRQRGLELIAELFLLPAHGPRAELMHQEFLEGDILFAGFKNPEASHMVVETNGVSRPADYHEGYYIFVQNEWLYFVYYYQTPLPLFDEAPSFDHAHLQSQVDGFYRGCKFQPS